MYGIVLTGTYRGFRFFNSQKDSMRGGDIWGSIEYLTDQNQKGGFLNEKEDIIIDEINLDISLDDPMITHALERCEQLYETPSFRAYKGIKAILDKLARYMEETTIEHGRDGNITALTNVAAKFDAIRQSYKGAFTDMQKEQESTVRGGQGLAYDQL